MRASKTLEVVLLALPLGFIGCGGSTDHWYEDSKALDDRKSDYVDGQMRQGGMTEIEAQKAWALQYSVEQTYKLMRPPAEVQGEELQDKLSK
ncbi:MAG: hypothetical protein H3C50_03020 [Kiritimatiellae bacterium]|nr:hypothetical protein [Kiritimatiellia bacterium]MCO5069124.1 hypothetical protein [Kiritimatiellia bacterium]